MANGTETPPSAPPTPTAGDGVKAEVKKVTTEATQTAAKGIGYYVVFAIVLVVGAVVLLKASGPTETRVDPSATPGSVAASTAPASPVASPAEPKARVVETTTTSEGGGIGK